VLAAHVCAAQAQFVPQEIAQQQAGLDLSLVSLPVDGEEMGWRVVMDAFNGQELRNSGT
jgi:hypothetical protein